LVLASVGVAVNPRHRGGWPGATADRETHAALDRFASIAKVTAAMSEEAARRGATGSVLMPRLRAITVIARTSPTPGSSERTAAYSPRPASGVRLTPRCVTVEAGKKTRRSAR